MRLMQARSARNATKSTQRRRTLIGVVGHMLAPGVAVSGGVVEKRIVTSQVVNLTNIRQKMTNLGKKMALVSMEIKKNRGLI